MSELQFLWLQHGVVDLFPTVVEPFVPRVRVLADEDFVTFVLVVATSSKRGSILLLKRTCVSDLGAPTDFSVQVAMSHLLEL